MQLVICPYVPSRIWQESFRSLECHLKSTRARDERGGMGWSTMYNGGERERERERKTTFARGWNYTYIHTRARARAHVRIHNIHAYMSDKRIRASLRLARWTENRHFSRILSVAIQIGNVDNTVNVPFFTISDRYLRHTFLDSEIRTIVAQHRSIVT